MSRMTIVFMLLYMSTCCLAQLDSASRPTLVLNGFITIHLKSSPQLKTTAVKLSTNHSFPQFDVDFTNDSLSAARSEIFITNPCRNLQLSFLTIADSTYQILGFPGDTIEVFVIYGKSNGMQVNFEGENKKIQDYYRAKTRFIREPIQVCIGVSAPTLSVFKEKIDSTYNALTGFLKDYNSENNLPDWFLTYETNDLNYSDAWLRYYMVWYQTEYQKKTQIIPETYYDFLNRTKVRNASAMYQKEYLMFLDSYLNAKRSNSQAQILTSGGYNKIMEELGDQIGNFFAIWEFSKIVQNPNTYKPTDLINIPPNYQFLIDYLQNRAMANISVLKSGDKAPNFALVDSNDSLITLNQYKGNVVYISFWFTTCGGCIREIPFENKLVQQFKNQPVKIISICTNTSSVNDDQQIVKWKSASEQFGLKAVDLYANSSWTTTLTEKYRINVYPHYILIDADGKVIENYTDRPSEGAAVKIEKALENIGK